MKKTFVLIFLSILFLMGFIFQETKPIFVLHKANTRGLNEAGGWLLSRPTFSFGDYYDPQRLNFGALRVLNDDRVKGGGGFGKHPHENMEIVSIVLHGGLEHHDNAGNGGVVHENELQIMNPGFGVRNFRFKYSKNKL